jgi:hypothetical protein
MIQEKYSVINIGTLSDGITVSVGDTIGLKTPGGDTIHTYIFQGVRKYANKDRYMLRYSDKDGMSVTLLMPSKLFHLSSTWKIKEQNSKHVKYIEQFLMMMNWRDRFGTIRNLTGEEMKEGRGDEYSIAIFPNDKNVGNGKDLNDTCLEIHRFAHMSWMYYYDAGEGLKDCGHKYKTFEHVVIEMFKSVVFDSVVIDWREGKFYDEEAEEHYESMKRGEL